MIPKRYSFGGGTVIVKDGKVISLDTVIWKHTIWREGTTLIPRPTEKDLGEPIEETPVQEKLC